MSERASKDTILNIPVPTSSANRSSMATPTSSMATPTAPASEASEDQDQTSEADECEDGIGEFDDGRSGKITLGVLIQDGIIEAGDGVMAVDYLGQTFKGDLMLNGKIKSQETGLVFNNPSAWAIYCKKIVNPSKKSGCGERWASVKYKGRKMDQFKTIWTKMKAKKDAEGGGEDGVSSLDLSSSGGAGGSESTKTSSNGFCPPAPTGPIVLRHNQLAPKHPSDQTSILLDVDTFQALGKMQPFTVSISSSALLVLDLHSHMVKEPVCGYLAGQWDLNSHNLAVTHAFPCLTRNADEAARIESEIYSQIYGRHLSLVGWYRGSPGMPPLPSLKDSEAQLEYQMKLLGNSDSTYSPCIGIITSPFTSMSNESSVLAYWVVPPPDTIPVEYGRPLKMNYTVVTDPCLSQETLNNITAVIQYYLTHPQRVNFINQFNSDTKFITKMGRTLLPKFPRDQDERLWRYIRKLILSDCDTEVEDPLLIRPPTLMANGINGGKETTVSAASPASRRNSSRRQTHDGNGSDEEEIDDDEENALSALRNVRNNGSSDMSTPPVPTEDVISLLLQRQTPVNSNLNRTDNADTSDRPAGNNSQSEKEQSSSS